MICQTVTFAKNRLIVLQGPLKRCRSSC